MYGYRVHVCCDVLLVQSRVHQKPTNKNLLCQRWCRRLVEPPPPSSLQKTSHGIAALGRESKLRTCCVAFARAYDQWLGLGLGKRKKKGLLIERVDILTHSTPPFSQRGHHTHLVEARCRPNEASRNALSIQYALPGV